jgi:regulator of replication initiation timing
MSSGSTPPFKPDEDSGVAYDSVDDYKNDVECSTEENQQLRQKCETLTSELVTLKAQLQSLKEKAVKDEKEKAELLSTNKGLEATLKEKEEEIAALKNDVQDLTKDNQQLWKDWETANEDSTDSSEEELQTSVQTEGVSPTDSRQGICIVFGNELISQTEDDLNNQGTGKAERVAEQGGGQLGGLKGRPEDDSLIAIGPEDIKVMKKCIKDTATGILQFHERKEQLLSTQSASYSAQQQPTSGNYIEAEVLIELNLSVADTLETVKKILRLKLGYDMKELKKYCDVFLKDLKIPAGQAVCLPESEVLVGMRNAAAHANVVYSWAVKGYPTPAVVLYQKKKKFEKYHEVYNQSTAEFFLMCSNLRKLFLCHWEPLREYIPRPNFSNSQKEEVVLPAEEESSFNNLGTGSLVFLVTFLYHGLHVSGVLYL